jgi:hypothetical protein
MEGTLDWQALVEGLRQGAAEVRSTRNADATDADYTAHRTAGIVLDRLAEAIEKALK